MGFLWNRGGRSQTNVVLFATIILAFSSDIDKVSSIQLEDNPYETWPEFDKRNLGSLARDGYIRNGNILTGYKRSIATLAKNGQLPTLQAPSPPATAEVRDTGDNKPNTASIAGMRGFYAFKRNVAALAKNGARGGKRSSSYDYNEKRNLGSLAKSGYIIRGVNDGYGKRQGNSLQDEYYFPFYQTPELPASEFVDDDYNELYDNSGTPDVDVYPNDLLSLQQNFDKRNVGALLRQTAYDSRVSGKRNVGLPNHGIFRTPSSGGGSRSKRYMLAFPGKVANQEGYDDTMTYDNEWGDDGTDYYQNPEKRYLASSYINQNNEDSKFGVDKRHIGSLARMGWLPQFRSAGIRYNRAGRGRELFSSYNDPYRKYSSLQTHGFGKYITGSYKNDPEISPYDTSIPPSSILADQESPAGERGTGRPISARYSKNDDLQATHLHTIHQSHIEPQKSSSRRTRWTHSQKGDRPKFYAFRSMVFPSAKSQSYQMLTSTKEFPGNTFPNMNSLPNRLKNRFN